MMSRAATGRWLLAVCTPSLFPKVVCSGRNTIVSYVQQLRHMIYLYRYVLEAIIVYIIYQKLFFFCSRFFAKDEKTI